MEASVQVALVSVFATTITTIGVILVAMINARKESEAREEGQHQNDQDKTEVREHRAGPLREIYLGTDVTIDEGTILERILALVDDNYRKDEQLLLLRRKIRDMQKIIDGLREELRQKGDHA